MYCAIASHLLVPVPIEKHEFGAAQSEGPYNESEDTDNRREGVIRSVGV
jgi:hypothetical protein